MGNSVVAKTKAPIPADDVKDSKKEFAQLKKQYGWKNEEQYIFMNRQIMYAGSKDEIIANYDNFIQKNILGGQDADISIPLGIYNHYSDYFNHTILESFNQLTHTNPYNDDFPLQKKCQDGINEWLLIAYMNCRSCKQKNSYSVRFMFQVAIFTRVDKNAQQKLEQIANEQRIQDQQQIAVAANNEDNKEAEKEYKIKIPQRLNDDQLAQFQEKFKQYIGEYGWNKEEIFILMERQVLHTGMHDDIVPKYVDFFEKVVFGDKNSDHSMPIGVYDHYLGALSNTIENSLSQVDDEDINEYEDTFKLQQKVDDGEREWLLIALLNCNIATKPNKTKFYVRYAVQVSVYSRMDTRMKRLQKDDKIKQAQEEILNQVKAVQEAPNDNVEGGGDNATAFIDVVDYGAMGLQKDPKPNEEQKAKEQNKGPLQHKAKPEEIVTDLLPLRIFGDGGSKFVCEQCQRVPLKIAACNNGHIFCQKCIKFLMEKNSLCPVDMAQIQNPMLNNHILNRMVQMERVVCLYSSVCAIGSEGGKTPKGDYCNWEGSVSELLTHLNDCKFKSKNDNSAMKQCHICHRKVSAVSFNNHVRQCEFLASQNLPKQENNNPTDEPVLVAPPSPKGIKMRECFYCKQKFDASVFDDHVFGGCDARNKQLLQTDENKSSEVQPGTEETTGNGLRDDAWSMKEDYTAWTCEDLANWIGILDDDFGEEYVDRFVDKELDGSNFRSFKSEHYLISNLGMSAEDAAEFAAVVQNRIEQRRKTLAQNEAPWTCKSCSFVNDPQLEKCKICNKSDKE